MSFQYFLMADYQLYHKLLMRKLSDTELSIGQPKILNYLYTHDGAKQTDIAANCHIEPPTLTSTLNGMEAKGMIERRRLCGDRRTYYIFLTEYGKSLSEKVEQAFAQLEKEAFEHFSPVELETLVQSLSVLHEHLLVLAGKREVSAT